MNALVPVTIQPNELEVVQRTAKLLAVSGYFDATGDTPQAIARVAARILAGRELGFGPFAAVNGIHIIQGKPAVGANLMASAVKGSGRYDYRVRTMTDAEVSIEFFAVADGKRESLGVSTFTAKDAKLAGTKNMDKYPRNMLYARAMSNGVKWFCPDVFSGNAVYVPEELGATVDGDGNVVDVEPARRTVDAATGEILPAPTPAPRSAPENGISADVDLGMGDSSDNPFDGDTPAANDPQEAERQTLLRKLHAIGHDLYGDKWDSVRHKNVRRFTGQRTESSKEMTVDELGAMIAGMEQLQAKRAAQPVAA